MRTGYKQGELDGDWAIFAEIAGPFVSKVLFQEREDLLHDIILEMAKVKRKYQAKRKPLREGSLMLVAKYVRLRYWDKRRHRLFGLNCTNCTPEERKECRTKEFGECPKGKAHQVLSLNKAIRDRNGDGEELGELIPDGHGGDLDARLDARHILQTLSKGVVKIGYKRYAGIPLEPKEHYCLRYQRKIRKEFALKRNGGETMARHPIPPPGFVPLPRFPDTCPVCGGKSTVWVDPLCKKYGGLPKEFLSRYATGKCQTCEVEFFHDNSSYYYNPASANSAKGATSN